MANLKGAYSLKNGYSKQLKDLHHRLAKFGVKRFNTNSKATHSIATSNKRAEMSQSFAKYIESKYDNLEGQKLNSFFDNEHIKEFIEIRTSNLSAASTENYIRSFSSMLQGLSQNNITMNYDNQIFDKIVKDLKQNTPKPQFETNRAIKDTDTLIKNIANENYSASVIATVQLELGFRISEAIKVIKCFDKYFNSNTQTIENVKGKGNHLYGSKNISSSLTLKIRSIMNDKIISKRAYQKILSKFNQKSHNFRFTYAKNLFNFLLKSGKNYNDILKEVSKSLGHKRIGMTRYYLARS